MNPIGYLFVFLIILLPFPSSADKGYGDWLDGFSGYPDMRERRILVLTNTCRMAPIEYRDTYIGDYNILLPQNYPATDPLYWHLDLNRASRAHSRDMADNHGLDHTSSDGTAWDARIESYYTKNGYFGENIASGGQDAFASLKQWIMDGDPDPAPDKNGDDHRKSIMNASFKEIGNGYAYGVKQWYHFWTQDFSSAGSDYTTPITSGAHFIQSDNSTQFMATYTDPSGKAPKKSAVIIDDTSFNLTLLMGSAERGTYAASQPTADDCRYYNFQFTDSDNNLWRHPQAGNLITLGEGSCEKEYQYPDSNGIIHNVLHEKTGAPKFNVLFTNNNELLLEVENGVFVPEKISILNCKGQIVCQQDWVNKKGRCSVKMLIGEGVYFVKLNLNNSTCVINKVFVLK